MERSTEPLKQLNELSAAGCEQQLLKCCGSRNWARAVSSERPFANLAELVSTAERVWWSLEPGDWLEAFRSHPKIGEQKAAASVSTESQQWSEAEQAGVRQSAQSTIAELASLNREYEARFGYIFIVCASGKSSDEMLASLRERLQNNADDELRVAAAEQAKITALRLEKLLAPSAPTGEHDVV